MSKYIDLSCSVCGEIFQRLLKQFKYQAKISGKNYKILCSLKCSKKFKCTKQKVNCDFCFKIFEKKQAQLRKSKNNFCSSSCSAKFINKKRSLSPKDKEINCKHCDAILIIVTGSAKKVCDACYKQRNKLYPVTVKTPKTSKCITCGIDLQYVNWKKKYCDPCRHIFYENLGKRIGKLSAAKQVRRSKNEVMFAELCKQNFNDVKTNEALFKDTNGNFWDADIILPEQKIAVLWNGIWHYQKVRDKHSVAQVQSRDKIKMSIIKDNGYIFYVIKDMGKYDPEFVNSEFEKFLLTIKKE